MIIIQIQDGTCFKYEGNIEIYRDGIFLYVDWSYSKPIKDDNWVSWNSAGFDTHFIEDIKSIIGLKGPLYPVYPGQLGVITNIGE